MSCKCQKCGSQYKVDLIIPTEIWIKITPSKDSKERGMLCGKCIMEKIEGLNVYDSYNLASYRS